MTDHPIRTRAEAVVFLLAWSVAMVAIESWSLISRLRHRGAPPLQDADSLDEVTRVLGNGHHER